MTPVPASAKKEDRKAAVTDSYVQAPQGLFPAPMHPKDAKGSKTVERFRCLGRAMAKALQDSRLLDIPFSYTFYRCSSSPLRQIVAVRTAGMNMVFDLCLYSMWKISSARWEDRDAEMCDCLIPVGWTCTDEAACDKALASPSCCQIE